MPGVIDKINKGGAAFGKKAGKLGQAAGEKGAAAGKRIGQTMPKIGRGIGQAGSALGTGKVGKRLGVGIGNSASQKGKSIGGAFANLAKEQFKQRLKQQIATAAATFIGANLWWIIPVIVVILAVLFVIFILTGQTAYEDQYGNGNGTGSNPLQITKTGPSQATAGQNLTYTINVVYPGSADDIDITDPIPVGTTYVSSSPKGTVTVGAVEWDAKLLNLPLSNPINITITLTLKATQNNTNIINYATARLMGGTLNGGGVAASSDSCHGIYSSWMSQVQTILPRLHISGANYGDPACDLAQQDPNGNWIINKDKILADLKATLPAKEAEAVFICIIPNESAYNADAWNPNSTSAGNSGTPGAFGLFQMNAQGYANQGQPEDVGDVVWTQQIANAIAWKNKYNGGKWSGYWPQSYSGCLASYGQ